MIDDNGQNGRNRDPGERGPAVRLIPGLGQSGMGSFPHKVVVALLIGILFLFLTYVLWQGLRVLLETFAGLLFALFLTTLSNWVSSHTRLRYGWSLAIVVVVLLALAGGAGWLLESRLTAEMSELTKKLPQSLEAVREYLGQYAWGRLLLERVPETSESTYMGNAFSRLTGMVSGVARFIEAVVVIFFVGIFIAAEPSLYRDGLLHLVPQAGRKRAEETLTALEFNLRWWLVGQIFLMVAIGATTSLGLWLIGIPLALMLGLIAGLLEMIPYIGAWLAAVPAALIALLLSPTQLLMTLGLYLVLHMLEGYVLGPLIQRKAVMIVPALTLIMQVLLSELWGMLGLFVAAPMAVTVVVLLKMLYVEDTLGDQNVEVPGEPGNTPEPVSQSI
jgi:predicted PurR-regulated permease PerM